MLNIRNIAVPESDEQEERVVVDKPLPRIKRATLAFAMTMSAIVIGEGERYVIITEVIEGGTKRSHFREITRREFKETIEEWKAVGGGVE